MKAVILIISIFLLTNCNQHYNDKLSSSDNSDSLYFSPKSEWGKFQKYIPIEIRKKIIENIRNNPKEFVAQLYESSENSEPEIDNLITISFNRTDSLLYYDYQTSVAHLNNKTFVPLRQERVFWENRFFNPIDTVFARLSSCDFWNQSSEIKVDGSDGRFYCILIKYKYKFHYVLRWSPDVVKDSVYPKRKEYMKLCDLFKNLGKIQFYDNFWNWYGQREAL